MTAEHWSQVKELFRAALEQEPSRRKAFLEEACAGDDALRREVESLLAAHEQAGTTFMLRPALEAATQIFPGPPVPPAHIGPYQILQELGHGGMGAVYLARRDDGQYEKQVA